MAEFFQRGGIWYAWVKDGAGRWRNVPLSEVKTKVVARAYAVELVTHARRQRDGLEPLAIDRSLTVRSLLRWWFDMYVAGKSWASREEGRFRLYFDSTDLVGLPVASLTTARVELFLQHWTRKGLAACSVNHLR